jgi:hypothetical protein
VRIGLARGDAREEHAALHLQQHLDDAEHPGASLEMTDVGLDRPKRAPLLHANPGVVKRGVAEGQRQPAHFDGIAQLGSGAVRLYVRDGSRIDARRLQAAADGYRLRLRIRCGKADGAVARY